MPVTYSLNLGQMHAALRGYKDARDESARRKLSIELGAVLWRFLDLHEPCVAAAAGVSDFDRVTVVPSSDAERDLERGNLRQIVGEICKHTASRFEPLLRPNNEPVQEHVYDTRRFSCVRQLQDESVLLIDDTWTVGANAQSAAWALKDGGAGQVALVVIGRHVGDTYADHAKVLKEVSPVFFSWETCAVHGMH